ncbi:MAG: PAS domain S-box protein [Methanomicrobiales archaeon]|nr:PAS domain S-box protein [Methanomicrobiales archaeon]MDI6875351.1 PAS domain S-box protein [Methanomicrobiales archaeon]
MLLVEDDRANARLIMEMLKEVPESPFVLQHAECLADGLALLDTGEIDVVLLDLMLPDSMRLDTVRRMIEHAPEVPIVVLTTLHDVETGIEAVQAGAQDYLFKGEVDSALLARSLKYAMERKRILEALKDSEARYRTIFETTGTATIILEPDLTIAMVNREFEVIMGYTKEEVQGRKTWKQLIPKGHSDRLSEHYEALLKDPASGMLPPCECKAVDRNGFVHDFIITLSLIPGTERCVVSLLDITERKRLEEKEKEYIRDRTFLSRSALKFVTLSSAEQIFRHFGEQLQRRIRNSVVLVGSYSPEHRRLQILAVSGMKKHDNPRLQAMEKVFEGLSFQLSDLARRKSMKGTLTKMRGGFQKLAANSVPPGVLSLIETYLKNRTLYLVGFTAGEELLGVTIIMVEKGSNLGDKSVIETFINQASVALQRKLAEEELESTKSRLQRLLVASPAAIYSADIQDQGHFVYTYMSDNIKQVIGYEPQEIIGSQKFWQQQIFPEDKKQFLAEDLPRLYREGSINTEYRFKGKDGSFRWIQDEMRLVCDSDGNPCEVVGYLIDITERKQIEEALMIKHSAMASAMEPMILLDHEMCLVYVNDATVSLWGCSDMDEVIGRQLEEFVGPRAKYQRMVKTVIEEGSYRGEFTGYKNDGSQFDARVAINTVRDDLGITCYVATIEDITEQKEVERESKKYRSMLEKMVVKRSTELTEAQKRLKEEISRRKQLEKALKKEKEAV